jgi:hypothetical protein
MHKVIRTGESRHFVAWTRPQEGLHGILAKRIIYEEEPSGTVIVGDIIGESLLLFIGEDAMMQIRVQMAFELLQVLSVQSTRQWHGIVTLNESRIYLFSEHDLMWTAPGEIVVNREWHTVQSLKFMLTVV